MERTPPGPQGGPHFRPPQALGPPCLRHPRRVPAHLQATKTSMEALQGTLSPNALGPGLSRGRSDKGSGLRHACKHHQGPGLAWAPWAGEPIRHARSGSPPHPAHLPKARGAKPAHQGQDPPAGRPLVRPTGCSNWYQDRRAGQLTPCVRTGQSSGPGRLGCKITR